MTRRFHLPAWLLLLAGLGCAASPGVTPRYTRPPTIYARETWSRRLPGGVFRSQTPNRIGLLVTARTFVTAPEVTGYLAQEEKRMWETSGNSQAPYHFYVDGMGNIYEGRSPDCQAPSTMQRDPNGLLWIAFLGSDLDIVREEEARERIVHLLAYLSITYSIPTQAFVLECVPEAASSRLVRDLRGTLVLHEVELALQETQEKSKENPRAYLDMRTRQLRTQPSAD